MAVLPNVLILGSAKCATTLLHFYMSQHPDVFMAAKKECHHDVPPELYEEKYRPVDSLDDYKAMFAGTEGFKVRGESSPMYLFYESTAERVASLIPDAKLIAVLRNPADRTYSAYLHAVRDGIEDLDF
ncbi:hypothetical protein Q31b_18710 [Novipirellula aureliae]|uniref:Sulfotransferase domain protein n=1 Tax=Novipirellula aureliae TaxID=2527966 RepID=A0A5C6E6V1_9BACT|nr:sulfotransferase domain-containing protein [Novipirellula aureliae]TWU44335.1 hypothetical protein Q31b_18710 [Novipirellula aureliae]